jgi:hypothetical protein
VVVRSRRCDGGAPVLRVLTGRELLAIAGWGAVRDTAASDATLSSMAGNAFSAFAFGPVFLAALGAWPLP